MMSWRPGFALAGWLLAALPAAAADTPAPANPPAAPSVLLFDVVTAKDVFEIGLTAQELKGEFSALENLAKRLADTGHVVAWEYTVQRAADGTTQHAPVKRVAIFKEQVLRIEPVDTTALNVAAPNPPSPPPSQPK
jgi:hypothetical protein